MRLKILHIRQSTFSQALTDPHKVKSRWHRKDVRRLPKGRCPSCASRQWPLGAAFLSVIPGAKPNADSLCNERLSRVVRRSVVPRRSFCLTQRVCAPIAIRASGTARSSVAGVPR